MAGGVPPRCQNTMAGCMVIGTNRGPENKYGYKKGNQHEKTDCGGKLENE